MSIRNHWGLDYWRSGEWQVCLERLRDLDKAKVKWNPAREDLFNPLKALKPKDVKVVILGQDPYPGRKYCSGHAFSISEDCDMFPPTLVTILDEYEADLGYPFPSSGSLLPWVKQGVLLWNVYPTCTDKQSLSHHWDEYKPLTWEILDTLSAQSCVIVTLGTQARDLLRSFQNEDNEKRLLNGYLPKETGDWTNFEVLSFSHPSPRAGAKAKAPFTGSRFFTTINGKLCDLHLRPIDWRLP